MRKYVVFGAVTVLFLLAVGGVFHIGWSHYKPMNHFTVHAYVRH